MSACAAPCVRTGRPFSHAGTSPRRIQPMARTPIASRFMKARIVSPLRRIGVRSLVPARAVDAPGLQCRTRVRGPGNSWTKLSGSANRGDSRWSKGRPAHECTARGAPCTEATADYREISRSRRASGASSVALEQIARDELRIAVGRRPVAATTREPNLHERAWRHELLRLWIRWRHAVDQHGPPRAGPAAEEPGRRVHRAIAEDRGQERLARAHAEGDGLAEAAAVFAGAA